ncbi:MAG TPA: hypothetical protein ENN46_01510 [Candidatus Woesearchaeota archaeon]|nr:hypothetical protein [Candidatus Woesearchaeota archaeon]
MNTGNSRIFKKLAENRFTTPLFLISLDEIERQYKRLKDAFKGRARVFYAIKSNPDREILGFLAWLGCDFEINTSGELGSVASLGRGCINSAPVKDIESIRVMHRWGVEHFAFDTVGEFEKLALHAPGCYVYPRLSVSNEKSIFELSGKFGMKGNDAVHALDIAKSLGLRPAGVTFHVGSQCRSVSNWQKGIRESARVFKACREKGIELSIVNIGGGFPIHYSNNHIGIESIAEPVLKWVNEYFGNNVELWLEPGRFISGPAGVYFTKVIGVKNGKGGHYAYVDGSVFTGLMEALQEQGEFPYKAEVLGKAGKSAKYKVFGQSCDGTDIIFNELSLPELEAGDVVAIYGTGAYSYAYGSRFNGLRVPQIAYLRGRKLIWRK